MEKVVLNIEMIDGTQHRDVRVIMADMIKYSEVRQRHRWPDMEQDQIRFLAFVAYAALTRQGLYPATTGFDRFVAECAMVSSAEETGDPVPPTE